MKSIKNLLSRLFLVPEVATPPAPPVLNHKHIVVTAFDLSAPPRTADEVSEWLSELVDLVGMKILMGPYSTRCDDVGNEGVTGIVCISTSHASVHCWDMVAEPFLKMDLYSCKDFDETEITHHLQKFGPSSVNFQVIDRNDEPGDAGWNNVSSDFKN